MPCILQVALDYQRSRQAQNGRPQPGDGQARLQARGGEVPEGREHGDHQATGRQHHGAGRQRPGQLQRRQLGGGEAHLMKVLN